MCVRMGMGAQGCVCMGGCTGGCVWGYPLWGMCMAEGHRVA